MFSKKTIALLEICICVYCVTMGVSAAPQGEYTAIKCTQRIYTSPEIIFSPEGSTKKFILLDDTDDGYLVLSYDMYGARPFDPDNTEKFDITDTNNIAYFLNNDFKTKGNTYSNRTYYMPQAIIRNVVEHEWLTEAGGPHTDFQQDYTTKCGFAVPSKTEVMKYFNKFGYADDTAVVTMMLRTSAGTAAQTGGTMLSLITKHVAKAGMVRTATSKKNCGLKPIFYLDKDFFINEKIDITTAGDDIKKLIKTKYSAMQLKKIYSAAQVKKLTEELPPQAKNVRVTGNPFVGETLKCTYEYYAPDGQPEKGTKIIWVRYNDAQDKAYAIRGAESSEYVPTTEDIGKGISVRVIPACNTKTGRVTEAEFYRNDILEIEDVSDIHTEELEVKGNVAPGGKVYAFYKYFHPAHLVEKGTSYEWQASSDGVSFSSAKALGTQRSADIPNNFTDKYIRVKVTLKNGKQYFSEACEVRAAEKTAENEYFSVKLENAEFECKKGETYPVSWLALDYADSAIFCVNEDSEVIAEGCKIYSTKLNDMTQYILIKDTCEKIDIKVRPNYDGQITVKDATAAVEKRKEEK